MAWMPVSDKGHRLFTIDEYLALERTEEERHEYLDGCIYAMAGESPDHGRICMNLAVSLGTQLRSTPCEAFSKGTKVRCGPMPRPGGSREGCFAYRDLVVVCGAMQFHDQARDVLLNPTVIVEGLSPSTEAFDRGEKFRRYRVWLPTLTDYVLVAQDGPIIDYYHRQEDGTWALRPLAGLVAHLSLPSIDCTVPLADVYERVVSHVTEETL
jgi:Uma2 family endonuclease